MKNSMHSLPPLPWRWRARQPRPLNLRRSYRANHRSSGELFGIHFDLHPNKSDTALGRDVTEENIRTFLRQCPAGFHSIRLRGSAGLFRVSDEGRLARPGDRQGFAGCLARKVTREERVASLIHYCVLWNQAAVEHHPRLVGRECQRRARRGAEHLQPVGRAVADPAPEGSRHAV